VSVATVLVSKWQWYRLGGCMKVRDMIGGEIARMSLAYVKLGQTPARWRARTIRLPATRPMQRAMPYRWRCRSRPARR